MPITSWPSCGPPCEKPSFLWWISAYNDGLSSGRKALAESTHMSGWAVVWAGFAGATGWGSYLPPVLNIVLLLVGLFLILLVLIQKGKGGGLAGAFGGSGGSSAFGSRAGDTFTRITIYVAAVWVLLIMITIKLVQPTTPLQGEAGQVQPSGPVTPQAFDTEEERDGR